MDRIPIRGAWLSCLMPLLQIAGTAHAQESEAGKLETITVTARKVAENLQDTPLAVSAFSAAALVDRQIFKTDDLDQITPNLQFSNNAPLAGNNASSQVFIRGIGQTDPTSTVDPGVGLYLDDVYMGSAVGGTMDFIGARKRDGYVRRVRTGEDLGDTDTYTATAKLSWEPLASLRASLNLDYTKSDENGTPLVFSAIAESQTFPRTAVGLRDAKTHRRRGLVLLRTGIRRYRDH